MRSNSRTPNLRTNSMLSKALCQRRIRIVLLVLSLIPFLNGCATDQVVTKYVTNPLPESLTQPCVFTSLAEVKTYGDSLIVLKKKDAEERDCNKRFSDIRSYSSQAVPSTTTP